MDTPKEKREWDLTTMVKVSLPLWVWILLCIAPFMRGVEWIATLMRSL